MKTRNRLRNRNRRVFALTAGIIAAASGQAFSAVINVPADQPTIQDAIDVANNGDEIVIASGTYAEAIDLLGKSISISGAGIGDTTIDASGMQAPAVTIVGVLDGVDIDNVSIIAGQGQDIGGEVFGGGLFVDASDVQLTDVEVRGGSVATGGGAAYFVSSTVDILRSEFRDNIAGESGGAINLVGSIVTVEDSLFENNTSDDVGGAIRSQSGSELTVIDSTFRNNVSTGSFAGGAVRASGDSTFRGTLFENNRSDNRGGALYVAGGITTIEDSIFRGNESVRGGAIHFNVNGGAVITDTLFDDNRTFGSGRSQGAAIYALATRRDDPEREVLVQNSEFINHTAGNSGRGIIYATSSSSSGGGYIRVTDSVFRDNRSTDRGAVAYSSGSAENLVPATVVIENSTMTNNTAEGRGGAFYVASGADLVLDGVSVEGSTAGDRGGVAYIFRGNAVIRNSSLDGGEALEGGTFSIRASSSGGSNIELDNVTVTNSTGLFGGAIFSASSSNNPNTITANRLTVTGNNAEVDEAGGITMLSGSLTLANSLVTGNTGLLSGGIYTSGAEVTIINSTIADNMLDGGFGDADGLVADFDSDVTVRNSIFWNDAVSSQRPRISLGFDSSLSAEWSNFEGGESAVALAAGASTDWIEGNIDENPLFADAAEGDYTLGENSPSINAGDSSLIFGLLDLAGNDRVINAVNYPTTGPSTPAVDHGAFEAPENFPGPGGTCIADWNGDGEVDINDFFAYLSDFEAGDPRADLNNDGEIDINDFFIFLQEFEAGC